MSNVLDSTLLRYLDEGSQKLVLQAGQLSTPEDLLEAEVRAEKEERSFRGLAAWHFGQFNFEPSWPETCNFSNLSRHCVHSYS